MDEYVREFVDETEAAITKLNNLLLELERSPDDTDVVRDIFRTAHTLKGNAGAMGLDRASDLAHAMEDILDDIRSGSVEVTPERMDSLFAAVDCLETMVDELAVDGEIRTEPAETIAALRAPLSDDSVDVTPPTPDEREATLARFSPPSDPAHDAYLVRMAIAESADLNNGLVVIEALNDAFDLIGTDPSRTAIENEEHGNRIDAVFGAAVDESAISAALEPVDAVEAFSILSVTGELQADDADPFSPIDDDIGSDISSDEANDMSVDDLLDQFTELDDIDALADEIDDVSEFEDIGEAGSFDDIVVDSDEEPQEDAPDDDDDVEDASAVFAELKQEVDMVGFDELQDELDELEFDEFDEEEVSMDELLGDDVDVDDAAFLDVDDADSSTVDPVGDEPSGPSDPATTTWSTPSPAESEPESSASGTDSSSDPTVASSTADDSETAASSDPSTDDSESTDVVAGDGEFDEQPAETSIDATPADEPTGDATDSQPSESSAFADELFGGGSIDGESSSADAEADGVTETDPADAFGDSGSAVDERTDTAEAEVDLEADSAEDVAEAEADLGADSAEDAAEAEVDLGADPGEDTAGAEVDIEADSAEDAAEAEADLGADSAEDAAETEVDLEADPSEDTAEAEVDLGADSAEDAAEAEVDLGADSAEDAAEAEVDLEADSAEDVAEAEADLGADSADDSVTAGDSGSIADAEPAESTEASDEPTDGATAYGDDPFEDGLDIDEGDSPAEPDTSEAVPPEEESGAVGSGTPGAETGSQGVASGDEPPAFDLSSGLDDLTVTGDESTDQSTEAAHASQTDDSAVDVESDESVAASDGEPADVGDEASPVEASAVADPDDERSPTDGSVDTDEADSAFGDDVDPYSGTAPTSYSDHDSDAFDADASESFEDDAVDFDADASESFEDDAVDFDADASESFEDDAVDFDADASESFEDDAVGFDADASESFEDDAVDFDADAIESFEEVVGSDFDGGVLDSGDVSTDRVATEGDEFDGDDFHTDPPTTDPDSETDFDSAGTFGPSEGADRTDTSSVDADGMSVDTTGTDFEDADPADEVLAGLPEMVTPDITVPTEATVDTDTELDPHAQSVRVDREQVDTLLQLVEGLVTSRVRLRSAVDRREPYESLERELDDLEDFTAELQETVMDVRLVPLQTVTNRLPRVVRDLARDQDKSVAFDQSSADVELDRGVLDRIGDPLIHLVRNAVDHGIEDETTREAADKPTEGTIDLSAERAQNRVRIEISDDGRGIDADRLRDEAVEADILSREEADELSDDEAYDLVFHSGLSTADEVTDVSGRGVGMDVVRRTVDELNGSVSIQSEPGDGTTVTMTLPVSVAVDDVLFVEAGGEQFGIPVDVVREVGDVANVRDTGGELVYETDEESVPVVRLDDALEAASTSSTDSDGMLVRVRDDVRSVALECDVVHTRREVVVKPFEGFMRNIPGISGATVRGRGEVITILDVSTL
ncbi:ATP-binding protein [Halovivax cerinus]|uniref:Chemotaxis protein CheA n=1 Tax=Halovivax cerinus TaxID=1487865 RepID=A0ABD5NKT3_9EURY|nr:ATP-binding protein [Halovivax cerinus]